MFLLSFAEEAQGIQAPPCTVGSLSFTLVSCGVGCQPILSFWAIPSLFPFFLTPLSPSLPSLSSRQLGSSQIQSQATLTHPAACVVVWRCAAETDQ